jgi:hypothetical protein
LFERCFARGAKEADMTKSELRRTLATLVHAAAQDDGVAMASLLDLVAECLNGDTESAEWYAGAAVSIKQSAIEYDRMYADQFFGHGKRAPWNSHQDWAAEQLHLLATMCEAGRRDTGAEVTTAANGAARAGARRPGPFRLRRLT